MLEFAAKGVSGIEMRPLPSPFVPLAILCLLPALSLLTVLGYVYSIEWYWVGWSWEKLALLAVVVGGFYAAALLYYTVVGAAAAIVVWATWLMWKVKEPVVIWLWAITGISLASFLVAVGLLINSSLPFLF